MVFYPPINVGFDFVFLVLFNHRIETGRRVLSRCYQPGFFGGPFLLVVTAVFLTTFLSVAHAQEPAAGEPPFREAVEIDIDQNRQVVFRYDRDRDGFVDYIVHRAQLATIPSGEPCLDTDRRYFLVPRAGYYLTVREPTRVTVVNPRNTRQGPSE